MLARDLASSRAGGRGARGVEDEPHRASGGGRAEELYATSGANGSSGLAVTSDGDGMMTTSRDTGRRLSGWDRQKR